MQQICQKHNLAYIEFEPTRPDMTQVSRECVRRWDHSYGVVCYSVDFTGIQQRHKTQRRLYGLDFHSAVMRSSSKYIFDKRLR